MNVTETTKVQPLLKRNEVAKILGVSERTIRRIPSTHLPVVYVGRNRRYRQEDVVKYIGKRVVE